MQNLNKNKVQTLVTHQGRTVIESKDNKMLKQEDSSLFLARKTFSVRNILDALFPHYGFLQIRGTKFICKWRKVLLDLITCSLLLSFLSAYSVHCFLFPKTKSFHKQHQQWKCTLPVQPVVDSLHCQ